MSRSARFLAIACAVGALWAGPARAQETLYALKTQGLEWSAYPSEVEMVDLTTLTSAGSFSIGTRQVMSLAVTPDQSTIYVADYVRVGVYTTAGAFVTNIPLSGVRDLVLSEDGSKLYAVRDDFISEIDTATQTHTRSVPITAGDTGLSIALSPDGRTLAVCATASSTGKIYLVNAALMAVNRTIPVTHPTYGNGRYGDVAFVDDDTLLMYDNSFDALYQFDVSAGTQLTGGTIAMGGDGGSSPNINNALFYSPVSERAYVDRDIANEMYIFDPVAGTATTLGGFTYRPFVSTLSPDDRRLYMASPVSGTGTADQLSVLDVSSGTVSYDAFSFSDTSMHVRALVVLGPLDKHWAPAGGGLWDTSSNWDPAGPFGGSVDTYVDPALGVTVTGPAGATTVGVLTIGATSAGVASLELQSSGPLTANRAVQITSAGRLAGAGILHAAAGITNDGVIDLGAGLQLAGGTLTNRGLLTGGGLVGNALSNGANGEVRVGGGERMVFTATAANAGKIEAIGGEAEFAAGLANQGAVFARDAVLRFGTGLTNTGSVGVSFGVTDVFGDVANGAAGKIVVSGGASVTFYDDVTNDGQIQVSTGGAAVFFGSLSGANGTTGPGTVYMEGDLRPGHSPAVISFGGDVVFGAAAGMEIQIAGDGAGQFDRVNVAGGVSLAGTLDVAVEGGYVPEPGTAFDVLTYASRAGTFADHQGLDHVAGYRGLWLDADYGDHALSLRAAALLADGNLDGQVGIADLVALADHYGLTGSATWWDGDFNHDNQVGIADLVALADHYGDRLPDQTLPEPAGLALLAAGGLALLRRKGHQQARPTHCRF